MYTEDMPIAVYFCFPNKGVKIGLRPGDVLFFNPLHYHCVSQRTSHYSEDEIFVTSFYMKSAQLGRNDNSIPFENVHVA
jgi:ectoine hydroxylase-related dioxygenase (phytanoyl-CoA dioxygenase family)